MLGMIVPAGVEYEECFGELPGGVLFAEEELVIGHAVPVRRREFATVGVSAAADPARGGWCPRLAGGGAGQYDPLRWLRRRRYWPILTDHWDRYRR
jgi:hypothetical protein